MANSSNPDPRPETLLIDLLLVALLLLSLTVCRAARTVPLETTVRDSTVRVVHDTVREAAKEDRADSTVIHDSIYIKEYVREVVDSAGRVVRTDRERETATFRETERYASLRADYERLEREYEALNVAYLAKQSVALPTARAPTLRERLKQAVGWCGMAFMACVALWLLCRYLRR